MYVDDLANACEFFLKRKTKHSLINIGSSKEMKIIDYCKFLMKKLKINLKIKLYKSKTNGTQRKILDSSLARKYGWRPKINLDEGFDLTYSSFKQNR